MRASPALALALLALLLLPPLPAAGQAEWDFEASPQLAATKIYNVSYPHEASVFHVTRGNGLVAAVLKLDRDAGGGIGVYLINAAEGSEPRLLLNLSGFNRDLAKPNEQVYLSPDGRLLVVAETRQGKGVVHAITLPEGVEAWRYEANDTVVHMAASPDGSLLALIENFYLESGKLVILGLDDGRVYAEIGEWPRLYGYPAWRPVYDDGLVLAVDGGNHVAFYRVEKLGGGVNLTLEFRVEYPESALTGSLSWSPDGRYLLVATSDFAMLVDYTTREAVWVHEQLGINPFKYVAWSPDSTRVLVGGIDYYALLTVEGDVLVEGEESLALYAHFEPAAWSPDGSKLLVLTSDGPDDYIVEVYSADGERLTLNPDPLDVKYDLIELASSIVGAEWLADGRLVVYYDVSGAGKVGLAVYDADLNLEALTLSVLPGLYQDALVYCGGRFVGLGGVVAYYDLVKPIRVADGIYYWPVGAMGEERFTRELASDGEPVGTVEVTVLYGVVNMYDFRQAGSLGDAKYKVAAAALFNVTVPSLEDGYEAIVRVEAYLDYGVEYVQWTVAEEGKDVGVYPDVPRGGSIRVLMAAEDLNSGESAVGAAFIHPTFNSIPWKAELANATVEARAVRAAQAPEPGGIETETRTTETPAAIETGAPPGETETGGAGVAETPPAGFAGGGEEEGGGGLGGAALAVVAVAVVAGAALLLLRRR